MFQLPHIKWSTNHLFSQQSPTKKRVCICLDFCFFFSCDSNEEENLHVYEMEPADTMNKSNGQNLKQSYPLSLDLLSSLFFHLVPLSFVGLCMRYWTIWKLWIFEKWNFRCKQSFNLTCNDQLVLPATRLARHPKN
jgi:hypothetical protein